MVSFLLEITLAFIGVAAIGLLASWLRISVVPAYVLAGMALGPYGFGIVTSNEFITRAADVGLIILLFFLGIAFNMGSFMRSGREILHGGAWDALLNIPLGLGLGLAFGFTWLESLFLAGMVYATSSGIVVKALADLQRSANRESELILGVNVFQDVLTASFIAIVGGIALSPSLEAGALTFSIVKALLFVGAFLLATRYLGRTVSRAFGIVRSDELYILILIGLVFAAASSAYLLGLSPAIGAFLFGLVVSETTQTRKVERFIVPLRDLFASLFFFVFGMMVNFRAAGDAAPLLLAAIPLTIAAKIAVGLSLIHI